jgi:hypothetical protein
MSLVKIDVYNHILMSRHDTNSIRKYELLTLNIKVVMASPHYRNLEIESPLNEI